MSFLVFCNFSTFQFMYPLHTRCPYPATSLLPPAGCSPSLLHYLPFEIWKSTFLFGRDCGQSLTKSPSHHILAPPTPSSLPSLPAGTSIPGHLCSKTESNYFLLHDFPCSFHCFQPSCTLRISLFVVWVPLAQHFPRKNGWLLA